MSNPISASPAATGARAWHGLSLAWRRVVASAPVASLAAFVARVVAERRLRRASERLSALDDRMLRDIGVARSDIERAVRDGRGAGAGFPHS